MNKNRVRRISLAILPLVAILLAASGHLSAGADVDSPAEMVQRAWRKAQDAGSYRFLSTAEQTMVPRPIPGMIGQGDVHLTLENDGAVVLPDRVYSELRVAGLGQSKSVTMLREGNQAFMLQDGELKAVEDALSLASPTNDVLGYLAAAEQVMLLDPPEGHPELARYAFQISGPRFAEYVRQQAEAAMQAQPGAPEGLTLKPAPALQDLNGSGELWVNQVGLPVRQVLDIRIPQVNEAYGAQVKMVVDLSDYGEVETLPKAVPGADGAWRLEGTLTAVAAANPAVDSGVMAPPDQRTQAAATDPTVAAASGGWLARPSSILPLCIAPSTVALFIVIILAILIVRYYRRNPRRFYTLVVLVVIPLLVLSSLLQAGKVVRFVDRQAQAAEARAAATPDLLRALGLETETAKVGSTAQAAATGDKSVEAGVGAADPLPSPLVDPTLPSSPELERAARRAGLAATEAGSGSTTLEICGYGEPGVDTDGDGLTDQVEYCLGTAATNPDTDEDGIPDNVELTGFDLDYGGNVTHWDSDPLNADSNRDTIADTNEWSAELTPHGLAVRVDLDDDGIPDLWDEDDDGDGVPDAQDLSPNALSEYTDELNLSTEGGMASGTEAIEIELQPLEMHHLRYSTTLLDWPADEEGNIRDLNDSTEDIRLTPFLLVTTNITPTETLLEQYGIRAWYDEELGKTVLFVTLQPVEDGGAVYAFYGKVAYEASQTADIQWNAKVVWMAQMELDTEVCIGTVCRVDTSPSILHQYQETFRVTGLQITKSENYEAAVLGTPAMPEDDRYLFQLFLGLSGTFAAYEALEGQGDGETALEEIADRFAPGYTRSYLTFDIPSEMVVVREPTNYPNQEAGMAAVSNDVLPAFFDAYPTYGNTARCHDADGNPVTCASLVLASETQSGVRDLSDFVGADARMADLDQIHVNLAGVPVFAVRNVVLRMYERNQVTEAWETMMPSRMLEMVEARYHGIYATTLAELYSTLRAEDMRFVAYTAYLWAYGGRMTVISVDGRALVPQVPDEEELAIQRAVEDEFVDNGLDYIGLATNLPGVIADTFGFCQGIYDIVDLVSGDLTGLAFKGQATLTGFAIAATVASLIMGCINTACETNPDLSMCGNETALLVANVLVGTLVIGVQITCIVVNIIEAVAKHLKIVMKNLNVAAVVFGFIGAGVGIAMSWVSFGIIAGTSGGDPVAWRMALGMAIVTTVWLLSLAFLNFIPVIGPIITAILSCIDFIISLFTGLFGDKTWSIAQILMEMFYSAEVSTSLESAEFGEFSSGLQDPDLGLIAGNSFILSLPASGVIQKENSGDDGDLRRSYVEGDLLPNPVAGSFHAQDMSEERLCEIVDGELHCSNTSRRGYALTQPCINGVAGFIASILYQTLWEEYMFWGTVEVHTNYTTGILPEDPELQEIYLDVVPATLTELWNWSALTNPDRDGDGLTNDQEAPLGTDPDDWDSDGDGLSDRYEWETGAEQGCDPLDADSDDDGLNDALERRIGSRINLADSDGDGLTDGQEVRHLVQQPDGSWTLEGGWHIIPPGSGGGGELSALASEPMRALASEGAWVTSDPLKADDDGDTLNAWEEKTNGLSPHALNALVPSLSMDVSPVSDIPDGRPGMYWLPGTPVTVAIDMANWAYAPVTTTLTLKLPDCFDTIAGGEMQGERAIPMAQDGNTLSWPFSEDNPLQLYEAISTTVTARVDPATTSAQDEIAVELLYGDVQMHKPVQITVDGDNPNVAIMAPADGAYLRGTSYVVGGSATDPTTWITERSLSIVAQGGAPNFQALPVGQGAWAYTWSDIADGRYTLQAHATDGMQHESTSAAVNVTVDNVPPVATLGWAMASGAVQLSGTATDELSGVQLVQVSINGQPWFNVPTDSLPNWSYDWVVGAGAQGKHEMSVRAFDRSGNRSDIASAEIVVDRVAPSSIVNAGADLVVPPAVKPNTAFDLSGVADEGGHLPLPLTPADLGSGMDVFDDSAVWLGLSSIHDNDGGVLAAWAGDLNADRMADLAVGLPGPDGDAGQVAVVYGHAGGWPVPPDLAMLAASPTRFSGVSGARLGSYLAAAGDVNGDSMDDLLIGERTSTRAFLIFGNPSPLGGVTLDAGQSGYRVMLQTPATIEGLAAAGDTDGDGRGDILIRAGGTAYLVLGRSNPWPETLDVAAEAAGSWDSVTGALGVGDVDNDQKAEWVALANGSITLYGVDPVQTFPTDDSAPRAVALGDVNGDDYADWLYSSGTSRTLVYGSDVSPYTFYNYGGLFAAPGDVDADGRADILLSDATGVATLIRQQAGELAPEQFATIEGVGGAANAPYATGADLNSNGSADLVLIPSQAAAAEHGFDAPDFSSGFISPQALPLGVSPAMGAGGAEDKPLRPREQGFSLLSTGPDTRYVDDDFCNGCANDGHTWNNDAFATIQNAVNASDGGGDTIIVYPGAYAPFNVPAGSNYDHLTVQGVNADAVFVDGGGSNAITVDADGVQLSNLTVRNAAGGVVVGDGAGELPLDGTEVTAIDHLVAHSVQNPIVISESAVLSLSDSTLVGDGAHPILQVSGLDPGAHTWNQDQTMAQSFSQNGGLAGTDSTLYAMPGGTDRTVYAATPGTDGALGAWSAAFTVPHQMPEEADKSVIATGGNYFFQMHPHYKAPDLGASDGEVKAVAVAANGDVYVGGNFSQIGGVNVLNIARWDAQTGTWNPLGTAMGNGVGKVGGSATVYALTIVSNGDVYIGGHFNRAYNGSTETPAQNIVRWNGSQWLTLGEAVVNDDGIYGNGVSGDASDGMPESDVAVYALAHTDDDVVIVGGRFRHFHESLAAFLRGEGHTRNFAFYHPTRWSDLAATWLTFTNCDVGNNSQAVRSLYWAGGTFQATYNPYKAPGILYAGGSFTSAGYHSANHVAKFQWDATSGSWNHWSAMGSGIATSVSDVAWDATNSKVYAVSDDPTSSGVYQWDGSTWTNLTAGSGPGSAVAADASGNVYAGLVNGGLDVLPSGGTAFQAMGSETTRIWDLVPNGSGQVLAARGAAASTEGGIRRWANASLNRRNLSTGTWELVNAPAAMDGGHTPLIAADDAGNLYATWNDVDPDTEWQHAHLYALPAGSTTWEDRGTSPTGSHAIFRELVCNGSRLYAFMGYIDVGGSGYETMFDGTWVYDLATQQWSWGDQIDWHAIGGLTSPSLVSIAPDGVGHMFILAPSYDVFTRYDKDTDWLAATKPTILDPSQPSALARVGHYLYAYATPASGATTNLFRYGAVGFEQRVQANRNVFVLPDTATSGTWRTADGYRFAMAVSTEDSDWVAPSGLTLTPWLGWGKTAFTSAQAAFVDPTHGLYRLGANSLLSAGYHQYKAVAHVYTSQAACSGCTSGGLTWGEDAFATVREAVESGAARVLIHAGRYPQSFYLVSGVEVLGSGAETTIIEPPAGTATTLVTAEGVAGTSLARVTLAGGANSQGFLAEGGAQGLKLSRSIIRDLDTGIRLREGSEVEIVNNTLVRNGDGLVAEGTNPVNVRNTLFAYHTGAGLTRGSSSSLSVTYNGFWGNGTDMSNAQGSQASVFEDPRFRDLAKDDLRLAENSPMIDMGAPNDPTTPGGGERVDIGYAEYNAAGFYVSKDYSEFGANDGLTWGIDAFSQIQPALDAAADTMHDLQGALPEGGYSVGVDVGTYAERVTVPSHVRLVGSGPDVTAIDAGNGGSAVTFDSVIDSELSGFTVHNASASGAGVHVKDYASGITLFRNVIRSNAGTGIRLANEASAAVSFNTILNNTGAGVYATDAGTWAKVYSNIVDNNADGLQAASGALIRNGYNLLHNTTNVDGVTAGAGTVEADPAFMAGSTYVPSADSPAIDAADPLAEVPLAGGLRADMGYKELIACPLTVVLGPDSDATVTGNAGVAQVEVGIVAVADATQPVTATLPPPATWDTLTPATDDEPLYYWSQSVSRADPGLYRVYSRATDAVGNVEEEEGDWYEGAFVVDDTAPTVTWTTTPPSSTDAAAVLAVAEVSGTVSTGTGTRDDVAHTYFSVTGPSSTVNYPAEGGRAWIPLPATGSYTINAVAADEAGNQAQQSAAVSVSASGSVVTVIEPAGNGVNGTAVSLRGYARFTAAGGTQVDVAVTDGATVEATLDAPGAAFSAWSADITLPVGEGTKTVTVTPKLGGVAGTATTLSLILDTTAPTLTITTPAAGATVVQSAALAGTAPDAGSGLAGVEVSVDGGYTWRQATLSGSDWSLDWEMDTCQDYVSYPAQVRAIDAAGNIALIERPVAVDNVPPTDLVPVTFGQPEGQHVQRNTNLTISWNTPVDAGGAVQVLWAMDQNAETTPTTVASGTDATASLSTIGDWYVHLAAQDAAGNQAITHYGPWHVRFLGTETTFSQSRESIILDGFLDLEHNEWQATDLLGIDARSGNPQELYASWDGQYVFLGWSGAWWTLDGVLWAYVNTANGGTNTAVDGRSLPGDIGADCAVEIRGPDDGARWTWNGSAWVEGTLDFANGPSGDTEVRVPWSPWLGRSLNIVAFALSREAEEMEGGGSLSLASREAVLQEEPAITPWAMFPTTNELVENVTQDFQWAGTDLPYITEVNQGQPTARTLFMDVSSPQAVGTAWCPGSDIVYDIALENPEPNEISGLTLALAATSGLSYQSVTGATLASGEAGEASWTLNVPTLAGEASTHVVVTARTATDLSSITAVTSTITLSAGTMPLTAESEPVATITHHVDGQAPTVGIDVLGGAAIAAGEHTFTGIASDGEGSGVALVEVSLDDGSTWQEAVGTLVWAAKATIPSGTSLTLQVRATDECGHTSDTAAQDFHVDSTPPEVLWTPPGVITASLALLNGSTFDPDPLGGLVKRVEVQVDSENSAWRGVDGPYPPQDGAQRWRWLWTAHLQDGVTHTLRVRASDEVGNTTVTAWQQTLVDTVAPRITVTQTVTSTPLPDGTVSSLPSSTALPAGWDAQFVIYLPLLLKGNGGSTRAPVQLQAEPVQLLHGTVTDGSGVQIVRVLVYDPLGGASTVEATLTDGNWEYIQDLAGWVPGIYKLRVQALDIYGNVSMQGPFTLEVEDTPIVGLVATNDGPAMPNWPVTFEATTSHGSNVAYTWSFGDGEAADGRMVQHAYQTDGTYTATVTATNSISTVMTDTLVTIWYGETTTTLSATTSVGLLDTTVTLTATVAPVPPAEGAPEGTVTFYDGDTPLLEDVTLEDGTTTFTTSTLTAGEHSISATFRGTSGWVDSESTPMEYLVADPGFTVGKACGPEPMPQEGPALFTVTLANTGNVTLTVTANETLVDGVEIVEPEAPFSLLSGETRAFTTTVTGDFVGQLTVSNTVTVTAVYTDGAGNVWTDPATIQEASASCRVGSRVNLLKWTQGIVDPTTAWTFSLWAGTDGFGGGEALATGSTKDDGDGVLDFSNYNLDKDLAYTLCEEQVNAGWTSFWQVDSDGDGNIDTDDAILIPYNPNKSDDPPADLGNRCVDLGAGTGVDLLSDGGTLLFMVNNTYPGGDPRSTGYWKNWNTCTGGGQAATALANGGYMEGFWLLDDVLNPSVGGGITWDDLLADDFSFAIEQCAVAVDLLDTRDVGDPELVADGVKMSSDGAYSLAAQLLAAQLNFGAGARTCDAAFDTALAGEQLLDKYDFDGTGSFLPSTSKDKKIKADYATALEIAAVLDQYNNGELCSGPAVAFLTPLDSDVLMGDQTLQVGIIDTVPTIQVEFFVDGTSIGVDTVASDGWSIVWDSTSVEDGSHTLAAVATNNLGETGSGDVVVSVDNVPDAPVVTITGLLDGETVSGAWVSITADATSAVGVSQVEFLVDGVSIDVDGDGSDGWSTTWDSTGVPDGSHTLAAVATDVLDQAASHSISVTVDNVPDLPIKVVSLMPSSVWTRPNVAWEATVIVSLDPMVGGAVVIGTWSSGEAGTCTTGSDGTCSVVLSNIGKKVSSVTFTVDNVALAGYVFDPSGPSYVGIPRPE